MKVKKIVVSFGWGMVFLVASSAFGSTPEPLYPAHGTGTAVTANTSPTFIWSPVQKAAGYEIAVFQHTTPDVLALQDLNAKSYPILSTQLDAPHTSWDCSTGGCLPDGMTYVWYVRAIHGNGETGDWSSGAVFEIDTLKGDPGGTEGETNTIYGKNAGISLTTGTWNTFIGGQAGRYNTSGLNNAFIGYQAGKQNTTGSYNSFHGANAGRVNTTGSLNVFLGNAAGYENTEGSWDTFLGHEAGFLNTTGFQNTFVGERAGRSNTTGDYNSFIGQTAGYNNTSGEHNSFFGQAAGYNNTTGTLNAFVGAAAGFDNSTGSWNTFLGATAGRSNITGGSNAFVGNATGYSNTTGSANTFVGQGAGHNNTSGGRNTYIGCLAGFEGAAGWQNVFIGHRAGYYETGSNRLYIANSDTSTPLVYGQFDNKFLQINGTLESSLYLVQSQSPGFWLDETGPGYKGAYFVLDQNWMQVQRRAQNYGGYEASPVFINVGAPHQTFVVAANGNVGFGQWAPSYPLHMASGAYCTSGGVWTNASSREYKKDIKPLSTEKAVDALAQLNPVEFAYKVDSEDTHVGFIAEDVPELVATKDRKGTSPMDVVAVLTKVVQEQQRMISQLSKEVAELKKELRAKGAMKVAHLQLRE